MKNTKKTITVAYGDGIGPEIMGATLEILQAAGAQLDFEVIEIGEKVYLQGNTTGIPAEAWDSMRKTKVFLKAPITTPQGGGYKSLNVTMRKMLGLYANVRPCVTYHPFVGTKHPVMDVVIIRENEEDLYAGIEHQQTDEVVQCLKLISRPGCEKIVRYAFEYAHQYGRKKVTCFTKDNIMKMTDGLFRKVFEEVALEYPHIEHEHWIIDIGTAMLADTPEKFDVIVTPNLYGDIISDVAAQITGSVGIAGSANIGDQCAMFEAIHGSAPKIAGMNKANPSGLLLAAVQMLIHIDQPEVAAKIHNAWLATIEQGIHTTDIYKADTSQKEVTTKEFTQAVLANMGKMPTKLAAVSYENAKKPIEIKLKEKPAAKKETVGVDIFLHWKKGSPDQLGNSLKEVANSGLTLSMITNRGVKVYPGGIPETFCTDHWRCRFTTENFKSVSYKEIMELMEKVNTLGFDIVKTENLCTFDGKPAFSLGQGQ
ncbi:MAG: NADP-dependent isocitrate dehydrogenase [Chryseotalea sp.]|jgi:isocitrate dehydrogenase|nr:NADP-dependent isocitrate dehydrogenase [Flammeovirgaceae bacterium]MCZ8022492.1 NADP-dependent isocitrate dehydrogenase [Cytophagales bacterium]